MRLVTLKKNRDFSMTYARGKSFASKNVVMIYLKRKRGGVRTGFSVSKKVGCAVKRNKTRRRMKEILRPELPYIGGSWYIIFVGRKGIAEAEFSEIKRDILYLLKKSGLRTDGAL